MSITRQIKERKSVRSYTGEPLSDPGVSIKGEINTKGQNYLQAAKELGLAL